MQHQDTELARRLCAAFVTHQMGVTLKYGYDRYFKGKEPKQYWLDLSAKVLQDFADGKMETLPSNGGDGNA